MGETDVGPAQIEAALAQAAAADDREQLWAALEPLRSRLGIDPGVARLWAEGLRASPARRTLIEEAEAILDGWPDEPALVGAVADALVRAAERRPIDEPPLTEGPASLAASACARCLSRIAEGPRADPEIGGRLHALRGNALRHLGPKRHADAISALGQALALHPGRAQWLYDLGLVHKQGRDFTAALEAFRAARPGLGDRKPLLWNLAIAASACGDGEGAAEAWRALGIDAQSQGTLPFVEGLEPAQVRLPTLGPGDDPDPLLPDDAAGFELVWVQPLSPCHGVVRSPTVRGAVADFGDVILWDGAPVGVADVDGRPVPRFPFLGVLQPGDERRLRFLAMQKTAGQVEALGASLPEGIILYAHGERVEVVCPRCASGETFMKHAHLPAEEHRIAHGKIIVSGDASLEALAAALDLARRDHPDVLLAIPALHEALGDTKQAGKHHKRWGSIAGTRGQRASGSGPG